MRRRELLLAVTAMMAACLLRAQQKAMPVIGYLSLESPGTSAPLLASFRQGLSETGYVEGQNAAIEYRWAEGHYDRLPALAAEFVGHEFDKFQVIFIRGTPAALAAKSATSTIPIVLVSDDAVDRGLVSLVRELELLSELVPQAGVIALLGNPTNWGEIGDVGGAGWAKGVQLAMLKAGSEAEIDAAFASPVQLQAGALVVANDPLFVTRRAQLLALASRHAVPAIYPVREYVAAGGLISYGPSLTAVFRQLGVYAGKILRGAKPADLPVEQPTTYRSQRAAAETS